MFTTIFFSETSRGIKRQRAAEFKQWHVIWAEASATRRATPLYSEWLSRHKLTNARLSLIPGPILFIISDDLGAMPNDDSITAHTHGEIATCVHVAGTSS